MRTCRGLAVSEEHRERAESARAVIAERGGPADRARLLPELPGGAVPAATLAAAEAAAGTSAIVRTQIAERVLGLPRG